MDFLANYYKDNVPLRMLLQLIPLGIGSAVDVYLSDLLDTYKKEKLEIFFREIESGKIILTKEVIESNNFLFAFFKTTNAVINTKRDEKIKLFANLFINGFKSGQYKNDQYEQFLGILDEISYLEIQILELLYDIELKANINGYSQPEESYWDVFFKAIETEFQIKPDILENMLTRLNRTGLYATITGTFFGNTGKHGNTTSLYKEFRKYLTK